MMRSILLVLFILTLGTLFSQELYLRGGPTSKHYSTALKSKSLIGFQASLGTSMQTKFAFNLDFSFFPINTQFDTEQGKTHIYNEANDTLVNYSGRGIFSFRMSPYILRLNRKRNEVSLGLRFGIDKPIGNRKNTLIEYDIKDQLSSINLGAFLEYHYHINHKHSLFINAGGDLNLFGAFDNSSKEYSRLIKGLKPITGFIHIGYAFIFIRA